MASFTMRAVHDLWADGTSVGAFLLNAHNTRAAVATDTQAVSSGNLAFTGLTAGARYEAFASSKSRRFMVPPQAVQRITVMTAAEYAALDPKIDTTLYVIQG